MKKYQLKNIDCALGAANVTLLPHMRLYNRNT